MPNHNEIRFPVRGWIGLPHALRGKSEKPDNNEYRSASPKDFQLSVSEKRSGFFRPCSVTKANQTDPYYADDDEQNDRTYHQHQFEEVGN
jgi:methionine-rich copper-binding protein CopC